MIPKLVSLFFLVGLLTAMGAADKAKPTDKEVSFAVTTRPVDGRYLPYREGGRPGYAGEIVTIAEDQFRYEYYTDVVGARIDYSGKITFAEDHVVLDHPGVPFPYRICGVMDGIPVLLDWRTYQKWKQTGSVPGRGVLYLHKSAKEPKQTPEPRGGLAPGQGSP